MIFEHYCKASYATGQDPTFEQILHKTTVMTINKFMILAKDFDFSKLHKSINRAFLIELFKKNAECYKEMSFEQFVDVISKLAPFAAPELKENQHNEFMHAEQNNSSPLSPDMLKMLDYMEIGNPRQFK